MGPHNGAGEVRWNRRKGTMAKNQRFSSEPVRGGRFRPTGGTGPATPRIDVQRNAGLSTSVARAEKRSPARYQKMLVRKGEAGKGKMEREGGPQGGGADCWCGSGCAARAHFGAEALVSSGFRFRGIQHSVAPDTLHSIQRSPAGGGVNPPCGPVRAVPPTCRRDGRSLRCRLRNRRTVLALLRGRVPGCVLVVC